MDFMHRVTEEIAPPFWREKSSMKRCPSDPCESLKTSEFQTLHGTGRTMPPEKDLPKPLHHTPPPRSAVSRDLDVPMGGVSVVSCSFDLLNGAGFFFVLARCERYGDTGICLMGRPW